MRSAMVSSAWAMLAVMVLLVVSVHAHNWIGSPSRAKQAAVTKPCQMRVDNQPHIQVGPQQVFQMEWTMGHGDTNTKNYYWVALHADDYDELLTVTTQQLDDYINKAPPSAYKYTERKWKKVHVARMTDPNSPARIKPQWMPETRFGARYGSQVPITPDTDADYIQRDPVMNRRKNVFGNNVTSNFYYEWRYFDNATAADVRVSYTNANYSWIEAVHRFKNSFAEHETYAGQFDLANFVVPANKGPGDYIYFFYWGGYRDCVDIDVRSTAVTNRYGIYNATADTFYVKIEHCQFYYMFNPTTPCMVVNSTAMSAQACLTQCTRNYCTGVQAARAYNPAGSLDYTPGVPFLRYNDTQRDGTVFPNKVLGPCGAADIHVRAASGCTEVQPTCSLATLAPKTDDYICYGLVPFRDQDFQAVDDYIITNDAADPRFYSTCWVKVTNSGFLEVTIPPKELPAWDAGDSCVDCAFRRSVQSAALDKIAHWSKGLSSTCVNCDYPTN